MYHRVQSNEYAAVLTYRQLFMYTTGDDLTGLIPVSHVTGFVVRSDELQNPEQGRCAVLCREALSNP